MEKAKNGIVLIIFAGVLWGVMGVFVRYLTAFGFSPIQIVCGRLTVAALLFAVILFIKEKECFYKGLKDIPLFLLIGLGNILLFTWCYFTAINMMDVSAAAILLYTSPIWVMLVSVLVFKERLTKHKCLSIILAFGGCVMISGIAGGTINPIGVIVGVLSGIGYGMYSIFSTIAMKRGHTTLTITSFSFFFASIGAWFLASPIDFIDKYTNSDVTLTLIGVTLLMGFVTAFLPFLFYTKGLESVVASKAAVLVTVEPIVATLVGVAVFKEEITIIHFMGIVCVLSAIFILSKSD